jgi:hypothetical protein
MNSGILLALGAWRVYLGGGNSAGEGRVVLCWGQDYCDGAHLLGGFGGRLGLGPELLWYETGCTSARPKISDLLVAFLDISLIKGLVEVDFCGAFGNNMQHLRW